MKGGHGNIHMHGTNGNNRRRWNVHLLTLIILLLFGGAVLGLMGTLRLRDGRIFNLLIKEKENQILSLQLLLQNEREHVQYGKMKAEELKMKVHSLRAQKKELNGKIIEIQSTISSLKDEQKILESAYEEQQNETKLLRERCTQNPQVESLTELLRQKEAEIDNLKHQIQLPANVSLNKNDPSILPAKTNLPGSKTNESGENPREDERTTINGTSRYKETESSIQTGEKREDEIFSENRKIAFGRRSGYKYDLPNGKSSEIEKKMNDNEIEMTGNGGNEERKTENEDSEGKGSDGQEITENKGGVKLEVQNNYDGSNRWRGRQGYLKRTKGKRWRQTKRKSISLSDEAKIRMEDQQFEKHDERANSKANVRESTKENIEDSPPGNNSLQHNANKIEPEYISQNEARDVKEENGQQGILTNSSSVKSKVSLNEVQQYKSDGDSGSSNELEGSMIQQHTENGNGNVYFNSSEIKSEVIKNQDDDDMKDSEESEMVDDGSGEFESDVQKNSEEEEAEDPEF